MTTDAASCFHCAAEIPAGTPVEERRGDETLRFCCSGCRGAYLLISGAGLEAFYRRRRWQESAVGTQSFTESFDDTYLARFVESTPRGSSLDVIIDGIRCASCVWLNEKILGRLHGVIEARVNYATGRGRIVFDPELVTPAAIFHRIAEIGYRPRPYTPSEANLSAQREKRDLLFRFGTAFFLTMQLMACSFGLYAGYFQGIGGGMKYLLQLFSLLVTTPVVFYSGWPFLKGAWRGLANRTANMELLVSLGALSSYAYSVYAILAKEEVYFETAAMIVTLILAGRLLENAAKREAAGGIERLLGLAPATARRFSGEKTESVDVSLLKEGDLLLVAPGERFAVDGVVMEGSTDVDESPATGESFPVHLNPGDRVIAGATNLTGSVRVCCRASAAESFISRVARLVEEAQSRKAPIQGVTDRVAALFVPAVLLLSLGTFGRLVAGGAGTGEALMTALAVLVIACPCALGLATPTAVLAATGAAAKGGVIFRGGDIVERLSRVTTALFDKTGTLTRGEPEVVEVREIGCAEKARALCMAAAVEEGSRRPIAKAICGYAARSGLTFAPALDISTVAGGGIRGRVEGESVAVGSRDFLHNLGVADLPPEELPASATAVHVAVGGRGAGTILLSDAIREEAPALVGYLAGRGIRTVILSGDRPEVARETAARLGMADGVGRLSPAGKQREVEMLRARSETVLFVGDGINDAPALGAADVGCAVAGGTDIAIETSDLVLAKPDLKRLARAHALARRTMSVIRQNLAWAFLYNIVGIPLAMTGRLTPVYAAAAMALSSLCVVLNSLRLGREIDG